MTCASLSATRSDKYRVDIEQGTNLDITVTVRKKDGTLADLTDAAIYYAVKARVEDVVEIITKRSVEAGGDATRVEILNQSVPATKGKFRIHILPSDTKPLNTGRPYVQGCRVVLANDGGTYMAIPRSPFVVDAVVPNFI